MACFSARPLRGRTCASKPGGSSMRQAGGHQARDPGFERHVLDGAQIHAGVFVGSVRVGGQDGVGWMRWIRICIPRYHSVLTPTKRVITVAPMPPEKSAYALARYSRSPDSIRDSIEWVRTHDSRKISGELLLPVRPRLDRRPGPHGDVLRRDLASWRPPRSKRSRCGTARRNRRATRIFRAPDSSRRRSSARRTRRPIRPPARRCWRLTRR